MLMNQPAAALPKDDLVSDTTTQTFMKDVIEESKKRPVLVDFWAEWCGPCKALTPVLEKVVRSAKGKVKLVKMNIDEHPTIPGQLGVQSIPAVFAFVNGQPADGFVGALPESQVQAFVDRLGGKAAGGEVADALKAAADLLAKGDATGAAEMYAQVLATEPESVPALAGLARSHVEAGNLQPARTTLQLIPKGKENDPAVSAARAALELAEQASKAGDPSALEEKVKANPADFQARLDLAVALNAHGRREEALAQLLEIIRRDRKWNDDAARKQLIQFFEAWGHTDPQTVEGRRRLSSILFS
ncbi:MAG TPA: thioredoxin [Xanthobacteraceae bacterium]|nr:thioredoxin [Xanthobacteraceae bacterium]